MYIKKQYRISPSDPLNIFHCVQSDCPEIRRTGTDEPSSSSSSSAAAGQRVSRPEHSRFSPRQVIHQPWQGGAPPASRRSARPIGCGTPPRLLLAEPNSSCPGAVGGTRAARKPRREPETLLETASGEAARYSVRDRTGEERTVRTARSGRQTPSDDSKDTRKGREDGVFSRTSCGPEEEEEEQVEKEEELQQNSPSCCDILGWAF